MPEVIILNPGLPYTDADLHFYDEAGDTLVLLSGAVYNKDELLSLSNITTPVPDPELIAGLFRREGPDFVKKLNGDFSILILRPAEKEAYLFRDHMGIRPLVYSFADKALHFSTDIISMCKAFSGGQDIDSAYLMAYFKDIDYRKTPNNKVINLLPGHFIHFSLSGIRTIKYWEPEKIKTDKTLTHDRMLVELKRLLIIR